MREKPGYRIRLALLLALTAPASAFASWTCTVSTTSVAFGIYNPIAATPNDNGVGSVTIRCGLPDDDDHNINVDTKIDLGAYANGTQRRMTNGTSFMNYNLYTNATRTTAWTATTTRSQFFQLQDPPPQTKSVTYTVYGRIPALQSVTGGSYIDSPVVTAISNLD